jgi:O-antigen ligase
MFLGQLTTISRGPILATLVVIILWALSARPMRLSFRMAVLAVVLLLALSAVGQVDVQGGLTGLVQTGDKGTDSMGGTAMHRVHLTAEFFKEMRSPPLFGTGSVGDTSAGRTFVTVDHEPLFLLLTKGLLGLLTYALLVLTPLFADVRRLGKGIMTEPYAPLVAIDLALCGASVAFFGLLQVFVWVSIAIMWSTVARATEFAEVKPGAPASQAPSPSPVSR